MVLTETTIIALAKVVTAALEHNMKLMDIDPELALAGLRRLERFMQKLEEIFDITIDLD